MIICYHFDVITIVGKVAGVERLIGILSNSGKVQGIDQVTALMASYGIDQLEIDFMDLEIEAELDQMKLALL